MNVFNRTYLKLVLISVSFTIVFCFFCNMMVEYILETNMKLVCDVYYDQISSKIKNDLLLLKSGNGYLTKNKVIVNYLAKKNRNEEVSIKELKDVLNEIRAVEEILSTISFVDSINLVDIRNNTIFYKNKMKSFDITKRPYYDESFFNSHSDDSKLTKKHTSYTDGKTTISIISSIYDNNANNYFSPIGAVILDIYVDDLLNYINNSFYTGVLETNIYANYDDIEDLVKNKKYNIYINQDILGTGEYLVFKFDKSSLTNGAITEASLQKMKYILWFVGVDIALLLFISIRLCFRSALMSINKLKSILYKLDSSSYLLEDKNEFRQLEILADTLNKSFDDKIQELIYYDGLTKLPNRKMLEIFCKDLIDKNKRFALIFIDLNKFKYINDVFGHTIGDEYLIKFSDIINEISKDKGLFTRYSGDEFILVYENYIDNDELLKFYNNDLASNFLKPIKINDELTTEIGFSAGVAIYPKDAQNFEDLINKSDFMMYITKKNKLNLKISFFDEEVYSKLLYREKIKSELKMALSNNEFYLNYQPIIDKDFNISKAEALIRWNNKELGFIPPDKFIKYLEETRQIIQVGYWIIEEVCKQIKSLKYENTQVQISINISPLQLMLKDFIPNVKSIIDKYQVDYSSLYFEIVETVLLDNKETVLNNISQIRNLGIKIALDDFGTGYSSFSYLRNYKLDILKIDKTFLTSNDQLDFDIINQIKNLAHLLNMEVIIEGVETKEQFNIMTNINIDYLQGYYFSKPLSLEEFKKLLKK